MKLCRITNLSVAVGIFTMCIRMHATEFTVRSNFPLCALFLNSPS